MFTSRAPFCTAPSNIISLIWNNKIDDDAADADEKNLEHHSHNKSGEEGDGDKSKPPVDDDCPPTAGNEDGDPGQQHPNLAWRQHSK